MKYLLSSAVLLGCAALGYVQAPPANKFEPTVAAINKHIAAKWQEHNLTPVRRCSDAEFCRRTALDLIGRIPTLEEALAFEQDRRPDKRARWVDRLLASQEYPEHWAGLWTGWLLQNHVQPQYRSQFRHWLKEQLANGVSHKDMTEKLLTATGKSDENPAIHFVLAYIGQELPLRHTDECGGASPLVCSPAAERQPRPEQLKADGQFDAMPITFRSWQVFLGYQIVCTQCHDHPFNADWKQRDFWGLNVFFRQVERIAPPPRLLPLAQGDEPILELRDNPQWNQPGIVYFETRGSQVKAIEPIFPGAGRVRIPANVTRRQEYARRVIAHPNFPRAFVNRAWSVLLGRGMNLKPAPDDFGDHNDLEHPELLDRLAKDFVAAGYNPKQLIRWICASDAYQLRSEFNETNVETDAEPYFSRQVVRPMSFDQLFESLWHTARLEQVLGAEEKEPLRQRWLKFLRMEPVYTPHIFDGMDHSDDTGLLLSLLLMNDKSLNRAITDPDVGLLNQQLLRRPPAEIIDTLFLATLSRRATGKEKAQIERELRNHPEAGDERLPVWQDLFWALLNSNEFILNH
ncbi:MAG: DUF1549 domain-containing protein [Planctomycetia bacterium]|nr:DUF1549 domain-containing protein [Planctomycetia bacterium]